VLSDLSDVTYQNIEDEELKYIKENNKKNFKLDGDDVTK
jgi:hypothetical protein